MIYDTIIIGAGPCGLATAARLRERHPSTLFTDEEQARYSWINRNTHRASIKNRRTGSVKSTLSCCSNGTADSGSGKSDDSPSMLVLDSSSTDWMGRWNELFRTFGIEYLRSPMFFHPDPSDRDALLGFVYAEQRTSEMQEIAGCVGKETSKHKKRKRANCRNASAKPAVDIDERDRKDYFAPSTACFRDFCEACRDRYGLHDEFLMRQQTVLDIDYDYQTDLGEEEKVFTVRSDCEQFFARTVVLAIGAGKPCIPPPFPQLLPSGVCHAMRMPNGSLLSEGLRTKIEQGCSTQALVIGGGLTSAQIADGLIRKGISKVWLLMRSRWKVKPFDVDLEWMSKFKNHQRAAFWTADSFHERLEYVQEARNGGSMTPRYSKILKKHIVDRRLSIHPCTTVTSQQYDSSAQTWRVETVPSIPELPTLDHIYLATGMKSNIKDLDLLRSLRDKYPTKSFDGLPTLTDDLMWSPDVPLFVTGKLATLQLGPGAGNLEGARLGAERSAWAIQDWLSKSRGLSQEESDDYDFDGLQHRYAAGIGSRFEGLEISDEEA